MASAIIPPRIRRGETLGICVPAGPVDAARLSSGLAALGDAFEIRLAPTLTQPRAADVPSYLSASDDQRADELAALIRDPDVRAIVLARGGYGLMRILERIDPALLRADPKPIVGFSDATALLSWAYVACGVRGIHGPMIVQLADLPADHVAHLIALLTEPVAPGLRPWSLASYGTGRHEGPLFAANLTLASLLVGTPWELPLDRALLLLEEVGERPYEIDRYLTQLRLTGQLARTRGVILGELTRCVDPASTSAPPSAVPRGPAEPGLAPSGEVDRADAALAVFVERLRGISFAAGAPVGHGSLNEAVPFGARAVLDLDQATLEISDPAVV